MDFPLLEPVLQELSIVQSEYSLSDIYILRTEHGFWGICLTKLTFLNMFRVIANTSLVDLKFIKWTARLHRTALRCEGGFKPEYVCTLQSRIHNPPQKGSLAHKIFLTQKYRIPVEENLEWDSSTKVIIKPSLKEVKS